MAIKNKENKMIFMIGIDVHCHITHMENPESVVREAMQKLSAIVTVTAEISHAEQALELRSKFPDFVFVSLGLHPEYCMKYSGKEIDSYMKLIRRSRKDVCAIGEVGLDYSWITKSDEQERSQDGDGGFRRRLAEQHRRQAFPVDLKKPLVPHMYDKALSNFAVELSDL